MLPDGWRRRHLHELVSSLDAGVSVNGEDRQVEHHEAGVLKISAVTSGTFDHSQNKAIRVAERDRAAINPSADRIIVSRCNTEALVGASAYVLCDYPNLYLSDKLWQIEPAKTSPPHMRWLSYWLASQATRGKLSKLATGTSGSMKNITKEQLLALDVPVPPAQEQRRIARVLSTWDQAIATTERLLANSRKQKQALMHRLLLKRVQRKAWPLVAIREICERVQRRASDDDTEVPILMISSGSGFVRQDEKYSRFMAGKSVENYIQLKKGEFAYNKGNSKLYEFGCVFPLKSYEQGLVPHVYFCFKLNTRCHSAFYEHLFAADYLHDQLGALVNTGVRNNGLLNIRPNDFFGCEVPLPPVEEQVQIATVLQTATRWIERHERSLEVLNQEKSALMAQLLTGKRRVNLTQAEIEATA